MSHRWLALCLTMLLVTASNRLVVGQKQLPNVGCLRPLDKAIKKAPGFFKVKTPEPHTYIMPEDLPPAWDWRSVNGTNWCTSSRNQHIPLWCASCYAMATTSALADRIRIKRKAQFPDFMIAAQSVLHCVPDGCMGGDADAANQFMYTHGIGPDTCQNYVAEGDGYECTPVNRCENCSPAGNCSAIEQYPKFGISEFGDIEGIDNMKAEIMARGPISCIVDPTPIYEWGFGENRTQIFTQGAGHDQINHVINVVGWGHADEVEPGGIDYWIIRNSWGEYWGANGYFRLKLGDNQLGMESSPCSWAVPTVPDLFL